MLKEVKRPDKQKVTFTYDALGRRLTKHFRRTTTHFLWSGNVPLHEWKETFELNYSTGLYDLIKKTNFHDIGDRIELWLDEYGDENIIEYIKNTKNPYLIGTLIGKN